MKNFALTGSPVNHSKSPQLFAAGYPRSGRYSYGLLPASSAGEAMRLFREKGLAGMNVTAPLKSDILSYADVPSEEARATAAANTILLHNGKLYAYNTDVDGVTGAFEANNVAVKQETAVVLGAGGAGKAAVYALRKAGAKVYWANRTLSKVMAAADAYGALPLPLTAVAACVADSRLVVNTLPAPAECLKGVKLQSKHVVLEADYATRPLYGEALAAGAKYIGGLWWLLYQAIPAYALFTGEQPDMAAMKQYLNID